MAEETKRQYEIVYKDEPHRLIEHVQKMLDMGWEPVGGPFQFTFSPEEVTTASGITHQLQEKFIGQAMIRNVGN